VRTFTIRRGKYAGEHIIFDNVEEANKHNILNPIQPWYSEDVKAGTWVVADDGFVIECLYRFKLVNKRHKNGQYTDGFRFCNGTFYVYYAKDGVKHVKNFYAVCTKAQKNTLGTAGKLGRFMTANKKHFVVLVAGGMDIYHAYLRAFQVKTISPKGILIQINKLMNDERVREALMEQLKPFMVQVEESIKEKTGKDSLMDFLVDQVSDLLTDPKSKMPKERRQNIKLMVELFGRQLGITSPFKSKKEIEEANYEEVQPPQLGVQET